MVSWGSFLFLVTLECLLLFMPVFNIGQLLSHRSTATAGKEVNLAKTTWNF